jgi:hypothetical protein
MPWFVGLTSTGTGSLRAGLLVPLAGCLAMLALIAMTQESLFSDSSPRVSDNPLAR